MRVVDMRPKTQEEKDLLQKIAEIMQKHKAAMEQEIAPLLERLEQIDACKPPRYVVLSDEGSLVSIVAP